MLDALSHLVTPEDYCAPRKHVFPSHGSFDWFVRQNKAALVSAGALALVGREYLVDAGKFDACVEAIGQQKAARKLTAGVTPQGRVAR